MAHVGQLFSKYCQNNVLFKVLSYILTHRMHPSVYFSLCLFVINLLLPSIFYLFVFIFSESIWFSMTFHDPHFNYTTFLVSHDLYKHCDIIELLKDSRVV